MKKNSCYENVAVLETAFINDIGHRYFIPFLALHEFEAWLFTFPEEITRIFPDADLLEKLQKIKTRYSSPEEINDGSETHPSARLKYLIPEYQKVLHGATILQRIGIPKIREACPHFNSWIEKIERLSDSED